jgi:hypothetical protein
VDRNDWVFVGLRLAGLFLLCRSALALPGVLETYTETHRTEVLYVLSASGIAEVLLGLVLGIVLFLGAPGIGRWLERKDARA